MTVFIFNASNLSLRHGLNATYGQNAAAAVSNALLSGEAVSSRERKERNHERYQLGGAV